MPFPKDFIWGAASASYQVEGAAYEDGKGLSIWDQFSHIPGKIFGDHNGDIAADAYHRYAEDLDLMQELGIRNYRFSIGWPRVFPTGEVGFGPNHAGETASGLNPAGEVASGLNPAGLRYYDELVNGCISRGITPWVTLYHWDLPLELYKKGGWLNRETAGHFADYAFFIASHFSGRVKNYITINEPQCAIGLGHVSGVHAPGALLTPEEQFTSWHNLMLGHGLAASAIRRAAPDSKIGIASTGALAYIKEHTDTAPEDLVKTSFYSLPPDANPGYFFNHQWFLDPVFKGRYPDDPEHPWTPFIKDVSADDLKIISSPIDFAGLNIYNGTEMAKDAETGRYKVVEKYPGYPRTAIRWPVTPEVLYWGPRLIYERYGKEICIMEDGCSCNDRIYLDGKVHDADRIDFLHSYLLELRKCTEDGIPVKGYFHWSLTDNFEWNSGYEERFGLIYIDYRDQRRIPKDSAAWYAETIQTNGASL